MKFRKKPVIIDAIQFTGKESLDEVIEFINLEKICGKREANIIKSIIDYYFEKDKAIVIPTLEGNMIASIGDWIIRGVQGEYYPCKPDIFKATYEAVEER